MANGAKGRGVVFKVNSARTFTDLRRLFCRPHSISHLLMVGLFMSVLRVYKGFGLVNS